MAQIIPFNRPKSDYELPTIPGLLATATNPVEETSLRLPDVELPTIPIEETPLRLPDVDLPVLIVITCDTCKYSKKLIENHLNNIQDVVADNGTKFHHVQVQEFEPWRLFGYPEGFKEYLTWFPMILLVPGSTYRVAIQNRSVMIDGVQIMNGQWDVFKFMPLVCGPMPYPRNLLYKREYELNEFETWFQRARNNPDFKRYQEI